MKYFIARSFCIFLSFFIFLSTINHQPSTVLAAPCCGRYMPAKGKWNAGAQTHIITNRKLRSPYGKVASRQYFYQMSWGVLDWFCLDGKIGIGDVTYKSQGLDTAYPLNFAGGYGFRARYYRNAKHGVDAILGFQH